MSHVLIVIDMCYVIDMFDKIVINSKQTVRSGQKDRRHRSCLRGSVSAQKTDTDKVNKTMFNL